MEDKIEKAIEALTAKITAETKADDALKYSQSALNFAHVLSVLAENPNPNRAAAET